MSMVSACCEAHILVELDLYYACSKCTMPCDILKSESLRDSDNYVGSDEQYANALPNCH